MTRYTPSKTASSKKKARMVMSAIAHPGKLLPPELVCGDPSGFVGFEPAPDEAVDSADIRDCDERDAEAADNEDTDTRDAVDTSEPVERVANTEFGNAVSVS